MRAATQRVQRDGKLVRQDGNISGVHRNSLEKRFHAAASTAVSTGDQSNNDNWPAAMARSWRAPRPTAPLTAGAPSV
ncbi:hypothetical protein G6F64_014517 [Rhizopus arrhizus]|uniref:Uncharacterized protein n=1 Tax=Rhizopus oryzae TaxID=64495 RepID=A0A9P6WTA9_RHIOR|nr:hypothetical protein G6F64_014517 [Rhizopus arrhizus]